MPNEIKKAPVAKYDYTQDELNKLAKAAEDPAVQAIVRKLAVEVFHTAHDLPQKPERSSKQKNRSSTRNNSSGG